MKNKILMGLSVFLFMSTLFLFGGCGHEHKLIKIDASPSTCEVDGNSEYYLCECGKYFSDSSGKNEIQKDDWKILAMGHEYNQMIENDLYHKADADCEHSSQYYYSCKCGEIGVDFFEVGQPLGHNSTDWIIETDSTCIKAGRKYKECIRCEIELETEVIEKKEHDLTEWAEVSPADCTHPQKLERHCKTCTTQNERLDGTPSLGHNSSEWADLLDANGNETGYKEKKCLRCGRQTSKAAKDYVVTYVSNGGSYVSKDTVLYGRPVIKPADPTRKGYTFKGWYTDNETFNNEFFTLQNGMFGELPIGGVTLYAKWEEGYDGVFEDDLVKYKDLGNGEYELVGGWLVNVNTNKYKIVSIADGAFENWGLYTGYEDIPSWMTFTIPSSVKTIGKNAFKNSKILNLYFSVGSSLESIGDYAFADNTLNNSVLRLPEGLKILGNNAFEGSESNYNEIHTVYIPSSLESLGTNVFYGQNKLTKIVCPNEKIIANNYYRELCNNYQVQNTENGEFTWNKDILFWKSNVEDFARLTYYNISGQYTTYIATTYFEGYYDNVTMPNFKYDYVIEKYSFYDLKRIHGITFSEDANIIKIESMAFGRFRDCAGEPNTILDLVKGNLTEYPNFIVSSDTNWNSIVLEQDWLYLDNGTNNFNVWCCVLVLGENVNNIKMFLKCLNDSLSLRKETSLLCISIKPLQWSESNPSPNSDDYNFKNIISTTMDLDQYL